MRHDEGTGVGARHVEQQAGEGGDDHQDRRARILVEEGVEGALGLVHRGLLELGVAAAHNRQRTVSEDRDPHQDEEERDDQRAGDELADGAPARDARQNSPTKGAHAIHQAQKNSVQSAIHWSGWS